MRINWQDPRRQLRAAKLSREGLSAGRIAELMGATKDAVASAMWRYGLYANPRGPRRPQYENCEAAA